MNEYYPVTSPTAWRLRVGSFKFPSCTSATTHTITGSIRVGGVGQSGRSVVLKQGSTTVATTTTDGSGNYTFTPVNPGTFKIMIKKVSGAGTYSGNVSVNAIGEAGKTVKISNGGGSTTTDASGNFSQLSVPAGNHKVTIKNVDVP